jgi:outer membrane protein TolC
MRFWEIRLPLGTGKGVLVAALSVFLCACVIAPKPMDADERARLAAETRRQMFEGQDPLKAPLTLPEATARAIKYQAEHRQKRMEEAAAEAQLDVARWDLLPKLMLNAGYSWRNNDAFGFGFTPDGNVASNPSASQERIRTTGSIGLAWNLLDFGVSYFRARQLADQKLIAEERRRKAVQILMHDVRVAWWRAEAAERLLPGADRLLVEVEQAIDKTRHIEARRLLPPVQTATLRRALLDLSQQIAVRRQDLAQARIELAALVNSPPGGELQVASPASDAREVPDLTADLEKLEILALESRPEIAEEGYRARISADEARKALVGLLPNLSFDISRNRDSNKFLLNNLWTQAGVNVAWNLVKLLSLPALNRSEQATRRADDARRMAMAMAVLTQTRIAGVRYMLVADEFLIWDEAARDDDKIVEYLASSEKSGIDTELELIRARARAMASHMNRDLAYANLQAAVARLFNSVGYDAVPREDEAKAIAELAGQVESRYAELERASFTQRAPAKKVTLAAGSVGGAAPNVATLLREGMERVLESAEMKASDPTAAEARLDLQVSLGRADEGRRPVSIAISAVPAGAGGAAVRREFKTTLSEPVDDEQWRVLGEGAAYRLIGELSPARITRTILRPARSLNLKRRAEPARLVERSEPLGLRMEPVFFSAGSDLATAEGAR